jgi:hypothetical protein
MCLAGGEEPGVRTAVAHRHAEPLGRPHDCVDRPLARCLEEGERQQVGRDDDEHPAIGERRSRGPQITHLSARSGIGEQGCERVRLDHLVELPHLDGDAEGFGPGPQHLDGLGVGVGIDDDHVSVDTRDAPTHRHRLGRRGRLIQHRRVGEVHAGEIRDHGLEVEERLEATLGDLGLVGGVGGVPGRVLEHIPLDHRRGDGSGVPLTDEGPDDPVPAGVGAELFEGVGFGASLGQAERGAVTDRGGHRRVEELVEGAVAERSEHLGPIGRVGPEVSVDEGGSSHSPKLLRLPSDR